MDNRQQFTATNTYNSYGVTLLNQILVNICEDDDVEQNKKVIKRSSPPPATDTNGITQCIVSPSLARLQLSQTLS